MQHAAGRRQLTRLDAALLDGLKLGASEEIHYQAPDGWDIEGFVTLPPSPGKPRGLARMV